MRKLAIAFAVGGVVLFFLPWFSGADVFDEQAFRWRLEFWMCAGAFVCFVVAMVLAAVSCRRWFFRVFLGALALLQLYVVVDTVRSRPRLVYADECYQLWDNGEYWKLYYGRGLVMDDAGGMSIHGETLDSCMVERYDSLGVMWVETWTNLDGKYYHHNGDIMPINPRFAMTDYSLHKAQLDSLLAARIHDSVRSCEWSKMRTVVDK